MSEARRPAIDTAVIPAAGRGLRMRPYTRAVPKEMLPVGRVPLIHHTVSEALGAGLTRVCVVIRPGKEVIREYLEGCSPEELAAPGLRAGACDWELAFAEQAEPRGLGDALLAARSFVGARSFVMLVPDQLLLGPASATAQLLASASQLLGLWSTLVWLDPKLRAFFPGSRAFACGSVAADGSVAVEGLFEEAPRRPPRERDGRELRGFGRTLFPPLVFDYLDASFCDPASGEVDLRRTFEALAPRVVHRGVVLEGCPVDVGTFPGYYHFLPFLLSSSSPVQTAP